MKLYILKDQQLSASEKSVIRYTPTKSSCYIIFHDFLYLRHQARLAIIIISMLAHTSKLKEPCM